MKLLVTGGCGFIGSNLVRSLLQDGHEVVNLDALTYAGHRINLEDVEADSRYHFVHGDITVAADIERALDLGPFEGVLHLAAESHVDRSILGPDAFVLTNVVGTHRLLEAIRNRIDAGAAPPRIVHVGTDEVYGSLGPEGLFTEETPLDPTSPYSASKASSDLLALAFHKTFDLPIMVTRCCNNYGPYQLPEKLIPVMVLRALRDESLPVYGDGKQRRDWIHVLDHVSALRAVLERGEPGRVYNVGADEEHENMTLVRRILSALGKPESLIEHVRDRPAHDRRYAIDASRLRSELDWTPSQGFEDGLDATVRWYAEHLPWCDTVLGEAQKAFLEKNYSGR